MAYLSGSVCPKFYKGSLFTLPKPCAVSLLGGCWTGLCLELRLRYSYCSLRLSIVGGIARGLECLTFTFLSNWSQGLRLQLVLTFSKFIPSNQPACPSYCTCDFSQWPFGYCSVSLILCLAFSLKCKLPEGKRFSWLPLCSFLVIQH